MTDAEINERLPQNIHFGTSSWTYPGWKGTIYKRDYSSDKAFRATSLGEYASFPLFRTVGVDSFFYGPPKESTLLNYSTQVPDGFRWVSKVWEEITIPQYSKHPRYGSKAGTENKNFLNPNLFNEAVLNLIEKTGTAKKFGPFVFQFQQMNTRNDSANIFFKKLDEFFEKLPTNYQYATEIRNPQLLSKPYFEVLNKHGVSHCFNHWTYMPPIIDQMKAAAACGGLAAEFYVSRVLTPLKVTYSDAVKRFEPYDSIKQRIPSMRSDVEKIAKRAMQRNVKAYVIVNNRAEGCSPQTIREISSEIVSKTVS